MADLTDAGLVQSQIDRLLSDQTALTPKVVNQLELTAVTEQLDLPHNLVEIEPVQMPHDLFKQLVQLHIIDAPLPLEAEYVELSGQQSQQYLNGFLMARYMIALKLIVKQTQNQDLNFEIKDLLKVKQDPHVNWTAVTKQLDKTGIALGEGVLQLLIEGNKDSVERLFQRLERYMKILCGSKLNFADCEDVLDGLQEDSVKTDELSPGSPTLNSIKPLILQNQTSLEISQFQSESNLVQSQTVAHQVVVPIRRVTEGVDIVTIQTDRNLSLAQNSLEFLLVTLSRQFELTPRQAAALLTNNNQYLVTACTKGIKGGNYQPVLQWYAELLDNYQILCEILEAELQTFNDQNSILKLLTTVASGLQSSNQEVATLCLQFLTLSLQKLQATELQELALSWFLSQNEGGLKLATEAIIKDVVTGRHFVQFVNVVCQVPEQLYLVYKDELQNHVNSTQQYLLVVAKIIRELRPEGTGLIEYWLDLTSRECEQAGRIEALALMTEIWLAFPDQISEEQSSTIVYLLKRASREGQRIVKVTTACMLFKLLDELAVIKNNAAPLIYKTLIWQIVEHHADLLLRELYYANFACLFRRQPTIPIALLVEPLLKQIKTQLGISYVIKTLDYKFFHFIANHPKLNVDIASSLMDLLSGLCLSDLTQCQSVMPAWFSIISRFQTDQMITDRIQMFIQSCLRLYTDFVTKKLKKQLDLKSTQIIVCILKKVQSVITDDRDFELKVKEARSKIQGECLLDQLLEVYAPTPVAVHEDSIVAEAILPQDTSVVPFVQTYQSRQSKINKKKAQQELEKIKAKKIQQEEMKQRQEAHNSKLQEKRKTSLRKQIEKRRFELGVAGRNNPPAILDEVQDIVHKPIFTFIELAQEEDYIRIQCEQMLKQHDKLWKQLYQKYSFKQGFEQTELSYTDLLKLLKDYELYPHHVTKEQFTMLTKIVNAKMGISNSLSFDRFTTFITQASLSLFPDVITFITFFTQPKIKVTYNYNILLPLFEPQTIAVTIIDSLVSHLFQLHIIEPTTVVNTIKVVKNKPKVVSIAPSVCKEILYDLLKSVFVVRAEVDLKEKKRRERDLLIKQDLERLREQKQRREEEELAQRLEQERVEKIREKRRQERARLSLQRVAEEIQLAKEAKQEPVRVSSMAKPPTKAQKEKSKEMHQRYMDKVVESSRHKALLQVEVRQREEQLKEILRIKSERQMSRDKQQRLKEKQLNLKIQEMAEDPVFQEFNRNLEHVYKYYCSQAKVDLTKPVQELQMKEFAKFGFQSQVVPCYVTADELKLIYRQVLKLQSSSMEAVYDQRNGRLSDSLTFSSFKNALVRISMRSDQEIKKNSNHGGQKKKKLQGSQSEERLEEVNKWQGVKRLQQQLDVLARMARNDARDGRSVQREFEAAAVAADKVKTLLQFIGLKPGDVSVKDMDLVLNQQSQKATQPQQKIKRLMLPRIKSQESPFQTEQRQQEPLLGLSQEPESQFETALAPVKESVAHEEPYATEQTI